MYASGQKAYKGAGMEGFVARWYTRSRRNEAEDFRQQARSVAGRLPSGSYVLEVAPGPGFFAIELAQLGDFQITGLDISRTFVQIATESARNAGVKIDFRLGNASAMPFANESFDFVYCAAAFKNFSQPVEALNEMHRVLRPGGEALIQDLRKDASLDEIDSYVKQSGRNWIDAWMTTWVFRCMLLKRAYTKGDFLLMAEQSRFRTSQITASSIVFDVRFTKPANAAVAAS